MIVIKSVVIIITLISNQALCDQNLKSDQLYKLMSGGLGQIFWDEILFTKSDSLTTNTNELENKLSDSCKSTFQSLRKSFSDQDLDIFRCK